eukprot:scaffold284787_cov19-Tisochrysis_lutea.AAC.1
MQCPLPVGVELACVGSGFAVLRCKGLYEAKVTLVPALPVPPNSEPSSPQGVCVCGCGCAWLVRSTLVSFLEGRCLQPMDTGAAERSCGGQIWQHYAHRKKELRSNNRLRMHVAFGQYTSGVFEISGNLNSSMDGFVSAFICTEAHPFLLARPFQIAWSKFCGVPSFLRSLFQLRKPPVLVFFGKGVCKTWGACSANALMKHGPCLL